MPGPRWCGSRPRDCGCGPALASRSRPWSHASAGNSGTGGTRRSEPPWPRFPRPRNRILRAGAPFPAGAAMNPLQELEEKVSLRLAAFDQNDTIRRIWHKDFTVWADDPTEISDRLGWLTVHEVMHEQVSELEGFASSCAADGLTHAVLAGMGGSSLAPEVLRDTFGVSRGMLDLVVLDTTHPDQILAVERSLPMARTLSHFAHFWEKVPDGSRFVAITDPATPLEKLASERGFRRAFLNPPDIGGRYSALSYFGLVPGALIGADLDGLLDAVIAMAQACASAAPSGSNPGARIGAVIGEAAMAGRDKLTLVLDKNVRTLGYWLEQLIAESTGKGGKGI